MTANVIKVSGGSTVVFNKKAKEAYILNSRAFTGESKDPLASAQELVRGGKGVRLTKAQLAAISAGLAEIALLGGAA